MGAEQLKLPFINNKKPNNKQNSKPMNLDWQTLTERKCFKNKLRIDNVKRKF